MNFITDEATQASKDWRDGVEIPEKYDAYSSKILKIPEELEYILDGHLVRIKAVKHRILPSPPFLWMIQPLALGNDEESMHLYLLRYVLTACKTPRLE